MRSTHLPVGRAEPSRRRRVRAPIVALVAAGFVAACGGLESVAPHSPITDPSELFMALTLDHGAVNLSTAEGYREIQLTATPRDANGDPIAGLPAPTFRSNDTTRVWVTPDGLVQARTTGTRIQLIAEVLADGNIRRADTALVTVTTLAAPPTLDSLTIEPTTPEGAVWSMLPNTGLFARLIFQLRAQINFTPRLTPRAFDSNGDPITGLQLEFEALDPDVVGINKTSGAPAFPRRPGQARMIARTTAYGVSRADTATFTATLPAIHGVVMQTDRDGGPPIITPRTLTIRPGGYVGWTNQTTDSVRVIFDDPESAAVVPILCTRIGGAFCDGGDIPNFMGANANDFLNHTRIRQFHEPGRYGFRLEPLGVSGTVIVTDEIE